MKLNFRPQTPYKYDRELLKEGVREPGSTTIFEKVLQKLRAKQTNVHVFDIGANIGYYTLLEARILQNANIYAIEMGPENVRKLKQNVKLNGYDNIDIMPFAAGAEKGKKQYHASQSNVHKMSDVFSDRDSATREVDVYPITDIAFEKKIPEDDLILLRMDVEGYEENVLKGAQQLLKSNRPMYVFIEVHGKFLEKTSNIVEVIENNQFTPDYISRDGGKTCRRLTNFDEAKDLESNIHLFAHRY